MDDRDVDDDFSWDGLVCPPLEDYAFNFDTATTFPLDDMFDDELLEIEGVDNNNRNHSLRRHGYGNYGRGKELNTASKAMILNQEEIQACRGETEEFKDNRDKKRRRTMDCYDSQCPVQCKDMTRLDDKNQLAAGNKKKDDYNGRKNTTEFDHTKHYVGVDNKRIADYDFRFEATQKKLRVAYKQAGEAKQQRRIQVIDFQKSLMEQPRSKAKAKERPSLRQKLMATGTRKCNKKFPPFKTLSSCIH